MTTEQTAFEQIIWEIDGYIREMKDILHPKIIPPGINQIISLFYDPVCLILQYLKHSTSNIYSHIQCKI